jgi:hypothetical protein
MKYRPTPYDIGLWLFLFGTTYRKGYGTTMKLRMYLETNSHFAPAYSHNKETIIWTIVSIIWDHVDNNQEDL